MDAATSTREKLLGAAVELLGSDGVQAVTHRNVEQAAGVARGSTRYHFGSREDLLAAVLEHMASVEMQVLHRAATLTTAATIEPGMMDDATQTRAMTAMTSEFLANPSRARARFELFLYASRRPELTEAVFAWRQAFVDLSAAHLAAVGAPHPEAAARMVIAAMDGMILHALTGPHDDYVTFGPAWMATLARVGAVFDGTDGASSRSGS